MPVFSFKPPNIPSIPSIPSIQNSIQNYRPRRKPKQSKSNTSLHASPFGVRRILPPGSPHPYASEEVVDISEQGTWSSPSLNAESTSIIEDVESRRSEPSISPFQPLRSPTMKLEIEVSPGELSDWIPAHLLSSDSEAYTNSTTANTPEASSSKPRPESPPKDLEDYDDDTASSLGSEDIVADLEAMKASDFVNLTEHEDDQRSSPLAKSRRGAPAPIRIPTLDVTRPKVQLVRSSSTSNISPTPPRSRPASLISLDEPSASAVSGRTLARVLIGNSFALSSDRRTSRYRSGTSVLTRSDSATLPFGEHPFYNITRDSDTFSPGSKRGSIIPPVPPLPELYTSPIRSAGSRNRTPDGRSDTKVIESVLTPLPGEEDLADPEPIPISFKRSRMSKISEANSSDLSTLPKSTDGSSQNLIPLPLNLETEGQASRPTSQLVSPQDSLNAPSSTARSSGSLENVLDYYELESSPGLVVPPPPPLPPGAFQPVFTPITEESSSQLSPPAPYKGNDSPRKIVLGVSTSPISEAKRIDFTALPRRQSRVDGSLLPIGARPRSSQFATVPTTDPYKPGSIITSLAALDVLGPLAPPPISTIFHRERSGSTPSPIQVTRDEHDLNTYNLTITPGPDGSPGSTPSTEGAQFARQTFPETPSAFSPGFTPSSVASPGIPVTDGQIPQTPKSATLPGKGTVMPSLAQQVLLTRAATSVRHSRQNSLSRSRPAAQLNQGFSINEDVEEDPDANHEDARASEDVSREVPIASSPSAVAQMFPDTAPPSPPPAATPLSNPPSSPSMYSGTDGVTAAGPTAVVAAACSSSSRSHPYRSGSQSSIDKNLPDLPPRSPRKMGPHTIPVPPQPTGSPPLPPQGRRTPQRPRTPPQRSRTPTQTPTPPQRVPPPPPPPPPTAVQPPLTPVITPLEPQVSSTAESDSAVAPPAPLPPSPRSISSQQHKRAEREVESPTHINFPGSPPPYDAVFHHNEQFVSATTITPTSGARSASAVDSHFGLSPGLSPASPDRNRTSSGRRGRMRPPLPAGPRRPSNQFEHSRARNGSVTSLASTGAGSRRGVASIPAPLPSPRFHTPSVRWRGYTMDAARWTFSSTQLQNIVSRAIKQSAEATSIRLLRLETLDNDIPDEIRRLEMQRTDVKAKYKMLSRRRAEILGQLASYVEGTKVEEFAIAARLVDDLKECSIALDKLAEDLHSADEQLSQLRSLCEVHSSSALAMALRKLNASFLRQLAEAQSLREQVGTLEAERDEAWKQAESLANEYDNLNEKTRTEPIDNFSKRSSRVIASRKSSIRFSKAGLRSARSSMSSFRMSQSIPSGSKSAFSIEDAPPVPPIPRRRPRDIVTDLPARSSAGMSTDGFTPNSETRAMIRAHEELCEMLGIMETRTRRTRSFVVPVRDDTDSSSSGLAVPSTSSRPHSNTSSGRPTSLPGSARLSEVYDSVMDTDRHAMLATLEMLADHE